MPWSRRAWSSLPPTNLSPYHFLLASLDSSQISLRASVNLILWCPFLSMYCKPSCLTSGWKFEEAVQNLKFKQSNAHILLGPGTGPHPGWPTGQVIKKYPFHSENLSTFEIFESFLNFPIFMLLSVTLLYILVRFCSCGPQPLSWTALPLRKATDRE